MNISAHRFFSSIAASCLMLAALLEPARAATEVRLSADRIEYRGTITEQANAEALALFAAAGFKPTVLWIESKGGSARAGIELGDWVFARRLDVAVDTFCFSSCANYVFTAGARKLLAAHASLVWHGGPTQPVDATALEQLLQQTLQQQTAETRDALEARYSSAQLREQLQASLQELIDLETGFFIRIGVDPRITTLGQRRVPTEGGPYTGWDYSLDDLATLGVHNVQPADGEWQPQFPLSKGQVFRIDLSKLPDFEPQVFPASPSG
jgi:ATP-dependent protease ClpP protease subunit